MSIDGQRTEQQKVEIHADSVFYTIQFRGEGQQFTAASTLDDLSKGEVVMVKTDHGLEPAIVLDTAPACRGSECKRGASFETGRRPTGDEVSRFQRLAELEGDAKKICNSLITKHKLAMNLVRVERFFNGSKIIFYFTADNRVDFRGLVKDLVQEFRTRVEMRQIGVRHETKMIGGLGTCGRELCCSSYMKKFDSVSIKMAKEQDLPLNPSKISGVCNRLLCCLTYEYDTYRKQRKKMPRPGKYIQVENETYKVLRQNPLQESVVVFANDGTEMVLEKEQWQNYTKIAPEKKRNKDKDTQ